MFRMGGSTENVGIMDGMRQRYAESDPKGVKQMTAQEAVAELDRRAPAPNFGRSQFLTDTKGAGIMNKLFDGYQSWFGNIPQRINGAIVSDRDGVVTTYASHAMVDRGELFVSVGEKVYNGMVIGERNKSGDLLSLIHI